MGVTVEASLGLDEVLKKGRAVLAPGGQLQMFIDSTVLKGVSPYVPMRTGMLSKSAILHSKIGQGSIIWKGPHARYLFYGKLMVDPITGKGAFTDGKGRFWSRPGVKKEPTNRDLEFDKSRHPQAGPRWTERYKADHLKELAEAVQARTGVIWRNS